MERNRTTLITNGSPQTNLNHDSVRSRNLNGEMFLAGLNRTRTCCGVPRAQPTRALQLVTHKDSLVWEVFANFSGKANGYTGSLTWGELEESAKCVVAANRGVQKDNVSDISEQTACLDLAVKVS